MKLERETEWDEFKRSLRELDEGIKSMASIMNKGGAGTVWFGVGPDGTAVGLDVTEKTLRDVAETIGYQIKPQIYPRVTSVPIDDERGRHIVRVDFHGDDAPYAWKGSYYVRVADRDEQMDPDELRRAFRRRDERINPWDSRPSSKTVSDIDEQSLRDYVARGNACGRIVEPYTTPETVLASLGLLRGNRLTNAADVLFCKSQSIRLKQGVLESHARTNILDLQQETGTIFDLVRKADLYILNNTRRRIVIQGPGPRDEIPEIPREAIREALFNAYCHMDWAQRDFVMIDIYYDAVEILNPGWFIDGQDPERHLAGIDHDSMTRNQLIARTLYRSKEIESYGSGLPRIKQLCDEVDIRVEYRQTHDGTLLVFHRNDAFDERIEGLRLRGVGENNTAEIWTQSSDPVASQVTQSSDPVDVGSETVGGAENTGCSPLRDEGEGQPIATDGNRWQPMATDGNRWTIDREVVIASFVNERGSVGIADIADLLGLSKDRARFIVRGLVGKGVLTKHGNGRYTYYTPRG